MLPSSSRRHGAHADQRLGRRSSSFAILKHAHSLSCYRFVLGSVALSASCLAAVDFGSTVLPV